MLTAAATKLVLKELNELQKPGNQIEDIRVCFNDEDFTDISAELTGPQGTPYQGGLFKLKLKLGEDYPDAPPKVRNFHMCIALCQ